MACRGGAAEIVMESAKNKNSKYMKEWYYYYKANNICVGCGRRKAEPQKVYCLDCLIKERESSLSYYHKNKDDILKKYAMPDGRYEIKKKSYHQRKQQGICVHCGKRKAAKDRVRCIYCLAKVKKARMKGYRKKHPFKGEYICCFCSNKVVEGYKVCAEHLQKLRERAKHGAEKLDRTNHCWRKLTRADIAKRNVQKKG